MMTQEQFRRRWRKSPTSECWLWRRSIGISGYGQAPLGRRGKHVGAHRLAWEIFHGAIPEGMHVLHRCDVRRCVNPEHLFLGTQADNMADKVTKGRQAAGRTHGMRTRVERKLDAEDVSEIRRLSIQGVLDGEIATQFGISRTMVWKIRSRRAWAHVP